MKKSIFKAGMLFLLFFLLAQGPAAADTLSDFENPPGCEWGSINPEPDQATAIAKTSDGYIVTGFVSFIDPDMYHTGDEKGGYAVFFKLNDIGERQYYRSFADEGIYHCDPGICVTCGRVDVTDFVSYVDLGPSAEGVCTGLNDVAVIPASESEEHYVFAGSRYERVDYTDGSDYTYVKGAWLLKTFSSGTDIVDVNYANRFPQEVDPDGTPLYVYYSRGKAVTPVYDASTETYDFLLAANTFYGSSSLHGSLFKTNCIGGVIWEKLNLYDSQWRTTWYSGGAGMTDILEIDDGYLLSSDGGVWKLDAAREIEWKYTGGYLNYRDMLEEGSDTIVVTTQYTESDFFPALAKINGEGSELWMKRYGCTEDQCELVKVVNAEYGYVMVGSTSLKGRGGLDVWLVGTDFDGNLLWDKTLGGEGNDKGMDLVYLPGTGTGDARLVIAATVSCDTNSDGSKEPHAWVVKTLKSRYYPPVADFTYSPEAVIVEVDTLFTATASDPDGDDSTIQYDWDFGDGTVLPDAGAEITHAFATPGTYEVTLTVWDEDGVQAVVKKSVNVQFMTIQWERVYDNSRYRPGVSVSHLDMAGLDMVQTPDGGFAVTGYAALWDNSYGFDPVLIKTDDRGMFLWQEYFEGYGYNPDQHICCAGEAIALEDDGSMVITGYVDRHYIDYENQNLWVVKTNAQGICQWQETIDNGYTDHGFDIVVMDDGYWVAGVRYNSTGNLDTQAWLARIDGEGHHQPAADVLFSDPMAFTAMERVDNGNSLLLTGGQLAGRDPVPLVHTNNAGTVNFFTSWPDTNPSTFLHRYYGQWVGQADDGGYLVAGGLYDQLFLAKVNAGGETVWETIVPDDLNNSYHTATERLMTGTRTTDGGYLMAGVVRDLDNKRHSDWGLFRFNSDGEYLWGWIQNDGTDPYEFEEPRAIIAHEDGTYTILLNRGTAANDWSSEFVLLKIGPGQAPIAAFEETAGDVLTGDPPLAINFIDRSSNGVAPYTYAWDFGDGTTSTEQNPVKTFAAGVYTISLTITDSNGDTDTYVRANFVTAGTSFLTGDLDGDCDVDGADIAAMAAAMGSREGDDNWNPLADLDESGQVNHLDLGLMSENLGSVCE